MRIDCPYCGARDANEFVFRGDATVTRPDPAVPGAETAFFEYLYVRDNPAGPHHEFWYHEAGCHAWLIVSRDTRNHEIIDVSFAPDAL